ncbi:MAG TPA: hypothetical protein VF101_15610 [Gaiellaceae bacterium]
MLGAALIAVAALASASGGDRAGLAFSRGDAIWVARADGSDARRLVRHGWGATLSPDGRRVAYFVLLGRAPDSPSVLYVIDVDGRNRRRIGKDLGRPAWSPGGRWLATSSDKALLVVDAATGERREVARSEVYSARFAPSGGSLVYGLANGKAGRRYRSDVYVSRLSDGRITRLTRDGHSDDPVWGGRWIVYRHFWFAGEWSMGRLRLMPADGSESRAFARGDERVSQAAMGLDTVELSADGTHLLACAAHEFYCSPVTFTVPQGRRRVLSVPTKIHELAYAEDLSRDGQAVLVDAGPFDGDAHHRAYAVPFDGGKPRLLVREAYSPSWAR